MAETDDQIRQVLREHAKLPVDAGSIGAETDLYAAGLTSHASVNLMLALEDAFDVEFPQSMLRKQTFQSIGSIREALDSLVRTVAR
ncbi:MAG TPA: acyl carrier protein [Acidimicrobiales bacterium]|nr:acyl carrier protein [Acidimicrobiales bacterium]